MGLPGDGAVLYFVVTAVLFLRTVSHLLPPDALAPTLFIGMGPAGLMGLDMVRLAQASGNPGLVDAMTPLATMMWGFGFWWMIASLLVIRRGYGRLPFSLSWWGSCSHSGRGPSRPACWLKPGTRVCST